MESLNASLLELLASGGAWAFLLAYAGGVLASFTPCVYPMIPITIGVIGANSGGRKLRGLLLSLVYVLGLALVYGGLGIFAAATGRIFGQVSTNPWAYFVVANLCFFFAAWMGEWINLPHFGLLTAGGGPKKEGFWAVLLMGGASGLVAAPCTAPVLATLLSYVATTGSVVYGGLLLFCFAYGMGTLLIILGTFAGLAGALPRSGNWLNWVKKGLALVMFAVGQYFLIKMGELMF